MKVSELMIGDLVQVPSEMNRYKRVMSTFDMDSAALYRPIPLTCEILEQNGFKLHKGEKGLSGVTTSPYYSIKGSPYIFCDGNPFAVWFEDEVTIKYVHQLQHVLRLCGLKKEIILEDRRVEVWKRK